MLTFKPWQLAGGGNQCRKFKHKLLRLTQSRTGRERKTTKSAGCALSALRAPTRTGIKYSQRSTQTCTPRGANFRLPLTSLL